MHTLCRSLAQAHRLVPNQIGTGIINKVKGINAVPKRWMYPIDEYTNNTAHVQNAVKSQYPDGDNVNGVLWLIQ